MARVHIDYPDQYEYNGTNIEILFGGYFVEVCLKDWSAPRTKVWTKKQGEDVNEFMALSDRKKKKYLRKS